MASKLDEAGIITLTLGTHDAGGFAERDFRLAEKIDA
jgi:pterin-4a-carbinolamine dehydratase